MPNEINDGRDEDRNRNPGVIHSFGARGFDDGGFDFVAGDFEVTSKEIFCDDAGNENNDDWGGVIDCFGFEDFFD